MIITQSNLKIKLISLALLFLIPITINLGIEFLYPAITFQDFEKFEKIFIEENIKNYNFDDYQRYRHPYPKLDEKKWDEYQDAIKEWKNSQSYKELKEKESKQIEFKYLALLIVIELLLISLFFINRAIIASTIILSTLYLFFLEINIYSIKNALFLGIPLPILGILSSLICLIIVTYFAHRDQNI